MREIITAAAIMVVVSLTAQESEIVKQRLALPSDSLTRVVVQEDERAAEALDLYLLQPRKREFMGYRIGIFFDNTPSARAKAVEAEQRFMEIFPEIETFMSYDNPYFKVAVGNCIDSEEATMLLHRVQRHFPKAYLMREKMFAEDLILPEPEIDSALLDSLSREIIDTIAIDSATMARNREIIDSLTLELDRLNWLRNRE